jgi:hypothetical protein
MKALNNNHSLTSSLDLRELYDINTEPIHVILFYHWNRIGGVMVSALASSAVDRGFELRSGPNQRL